LACGREDDLLVRRRPEETMYHAKSVALVAAIVGLAFASPGKAQDVTNAVGEEAFRVSCAVCHGSTGQGDGEFADVLTVKPSDLTTLAASNDGVFPYLQVFQTVDGRATVRAHGTSVMPIWGDYFRRQIGETAGPYGGELLARARIVALVDFVESLQR
jgi:mono/diheme cytochrome c family protein